MKRIVICCDGTWNSPDKTDQGVPIHTNVVKVAQAVKPIAANGTRQNMYYDPGIGTSGAFMRRAFDGATGTGLSRNVQEAYKFLVASYEPGDELYFFGFSRGAFTVRSLAGLIRNCGILRRDAMHMLEKGYMLYRSRSKASHPREKESVLFRRTYAVSDIVPIKFVGVWDTVGALGNPLLVNGYLSQRQQFHDTALSSTVMNAFQALAIDEKRRHFQATLWNQQPGVQHQRLEQNWFVGVHSNVGGGYASTGLSDIALRWMVEKAGDCELELDDIPANPNPLEKRQESRTGLYRLTPVLHRPIDLPAPDMGATCEKLHGSVLERYRADPDYRPENLEDYFRRNPQLLSGA
ncbi:hypothetical protein MTYP_01612 [Methylophilaceae bacterium]|nr:hypothetical protein MTYP_01612 [Methylophilaceae bacterium]